MYAGGVGQLVPLFVGKIQQIHPNLYTREYGPHEEKAAHREKEGDR